MWFTRDERPRWAGRSGSARGDGANRSVQRGAVTGVAQAPAGAADAGTARPGLLGHRDQLRAGDHGRDPGGARASGRSGRPKDAAAARAAGPAAARIRAMTADSWLTRTRRPAPGPRISALAQPRAPPQPDPASSVIGRNRHAGRDVEVVPVLPGQHRGQAEERPGGDRPGGCVQPQPGGPVHGVAGQARGARS